VHGCAMQFTPGAWQLRQYFQKDLTINFYTSACCSNTKLFQLYFS
jgi:hypothetical protein